MPGGDVEDLLKQAADHKLSLDQALRLADQICLALEHAHGHGIVHRDLKPGNVWLTGSPGSTVYGLQLGGEAGLKTEDGRPVTAKIGDFGLAVTLDQTRLTRAGMMVGTGSYMPPEQAMGGR